VGSTAVVGARDAEQTSLRVLCRWKNNLVPHTYEIAIVVIISQVQTLVAQDLFDLVDS
jgi:hypothetical protein